MNDKERRGREGELRRGRERTQKEEIRGGETKSNEIRLINCIKLSVGGKCLVGMIPY